MRAVDRLPPSLRTRLSQFALPSRSAFVWRAHRRAPERTGDPAWALAELDRLEAVRLAEELPARPTGGL
jgi:hypothetical protein